MKYSQFSAEQKDSIALTCRESMGGVTAQSGFELQVNYALVCLRKWLDDDTETVKFEALLVEGSGDIDALFTDGTGHAQRLFIQVKSGKILKKDFAEIVQAQFYRVAKGAPYTYDRFWLVADRLSESMERLSRKLQRLQRCGSFFDDDSEVVSQTIEDIKQELPSKIVNSEELVNFVARRVRLDTNVREARDRNRVRNEFVAYLMARQGLGQSTATACYLQLAELIQTSIGRELRRKAMERVIERYRQSDICPRQVQIEHTGPRLATLIPQGSIQLSHQDWTPIVDSLRRTCDTTCDANRLQELIDKILSLLEETSSPLASSRPWILWREQMETRISELAGFQPCDDSVSVLKRQAVHKLVTQLVTTAEWLCRSRKWESANCIAGLTLRLAPSSGRAKDVKRLAQSSFDQIQKELERMYASAQRALNSGQVTDAERILLIILREDPSYRDAKLLLEQIHRSNQ